MSNWLFQEEAYDPPQEQQKFIEKSILSILKLLSKIKRSNSAQEEERYIYKQNPVVKLMATIIIIFILSLARAPYYILSVDGFLVLLAFSLHKEERKRAFSLTFLATMMTFILLLPSMFMGNVKNSFLLLFKMIGTLTAVHTLSYSTTWHDLTKGLKLFFIPDIFIFVLDITIKYIFLLGDISLNMLYSLKLRSVGRNKKKYFSMATILGSIFIQSKEMGEELHDAMICRGFTGEYQVVSKLKFTLGDFLYGIPFIVFIILYFV